MNKSPLPTEMARLRKELQDMEWANNKTNEGIKILYKDLENKNEELTKLDKLRSKFVSTVSHELRTPLTIIIQTIENLIDGAFGTVPDNQRLWLSRIGENADHLNHLLGEILDLSKLESGAEDTKRGFVDLSALVRHCVESMGLLAEKKSIALLFKDAESTAQVWGSEMQLRQLLTNLIGNALKFTPAQGKIEVSISGDADEIRVCVSDTGRGIDPKDLAIIFDPFIQTGENRDRHSDGGIGLGLAICREIVGHHKGKIWAESELGRGSRFIFVLPERKA